jgi:hypothetical protein
MKSGSARSTRLVRAPTPPLSGGSWPQIVPRIRSISIQKLLAEDAVPAGIFVPLPDSLQAAK